MQGLEILSEAVTNIFKDDKGYFPGFVDAVENWLPFVFEELTKFDYADENMYIASFSRSPDTLSQWRSYGMFALELNEERLLEELATEKIEHIECHYVFDLSDAIEIAEALLHEKALSVLNDFWLEDDPTNRNPTIYFNLKEIISLLATTFKHSCFAEENEFRLVKRSDTNAEDIQFRVKNNLLIPFYELELPADVFSGIHLGPLENQKLVEQTLNIFTDHRHTKLYKEGVDIEYMFTVQSSDIPYRTL